MSTYKLRLVPSRKVRLLTQSTLDNEKNTEIQQEKFGDRKFHKPQPQPPQGPVPTPAFTTTKHLSQCKNQDHHLAEESKDQGQVNLAPEEIEEPVQPLPLQMDPVPAQAAQAPAHLNPLALSFKPSCFNRLHPETAGRWWHAFEHYAALSGIQNNDRCTLLGLLLTGSAEIWYNSLPPETRDDFETLEAAFREKYIAAAHTQLQRQMAVLSRTQRPAETVDEYITDTRSKMVDYSYDNDLQMTLFIMDYGQKSSPW